jgi:hypothetical protein
LCSRRLAALKQQAGRHELGKHRLGFGFEAPRRGTQQVV